MEEDQAHEKKAFQEETPNWNPLPRSSSLKNQNSPQELCQVGLALGALPAWHTFSSGIQPHRLRSTGQI